MIRRLTLAAAVLIGSSLLAQAEDPTVPPRTAARSGDSAEVLEAQLEIKKATLQAATLDVRKAKLALERVTKARMAGVASTEELEQAKLDLDMAGAQLDVRKAEVREAEVRLKQAKEQPVNAAANAAAPKVAVFNMAAVMRDYDKAKYQVYMLNQRRLTMSQVVIKKREEHTQIQAQIAQTPDPLGKEQLAKDLRTLAFEIQEEDAKINKALNTEASKIIGGLHDEIQAVVKEMAEENAYQIVFAYPDAVTAEEQASPMVKELRLKPPAAQPFFVAKQVDITGDVLDRLNAKYPPRDAKGNKVDMSKLGLPVPGKP